MNNSEAGAITGTAVAVGVATIDNMRRNGDNRRRINRIEDDNREIGERFNDLEGSGYLARIRTAQVSDFLAGMAYPNQKPEIDPSAFAASPATMQRPTLTEAQAVAPERYPIATNDYTPGGFLRRPDEAGSGELFLPGYALTHPMMRALLLGMAADGAQPSEDALAATFRSFDGLAQALRELTGPAALTEAEHTERWRTFFGGLRPARRGVVWTLLTDSADVTNTTTETEYVSVPFPVDLLAVGESARLTIGISIPSSNAADAITVLARLGGVTGTVLAMTVPKDPGSANDGLTLELLLTRRADTSLGRVYAVAASSDVRIRSTTATGTIVVSGDSRISITGVWSLADAANISRVVVGVLERL